MSKLSGAECAQLNSLILCLKTKRYNASSTTHPIRNKEQHGKIFQCSEEHILEKGKLLYKAYIYMNRKEYL